MSNVTPDDIDAAIKAVREYMDTEPNRQVVGVVADVIAHRLQNRPTERMPVGVATGSNGSVVVCNDGTVRNLNLTRRKKMSNKIERYKVVVRPKED